MFSKIKVLLLFVLLSTFLFAQNGTPVRIMSYNLDNYPNGHDSYYKKIIPVINPDAVIIVEMLSQTSVAQFLQNSLDTSFTAVTATGIVGTNSSGNDGNDCAFYYKHSVFNLISSKAISAKTRVISQFTIVHKITNDTLIIFGVHLKANAYNVDNTPNEQKRASAAASLRAATDLFKPNTNYIVCGDFNIFSSSETAFQDLVNKNTSGYFIDMQNVTGNWSGDSAFNTVCTYSSTTLDTRLDMCLVSQAVKDAGGICYKSFSIFGNDGNHFGKAVSTGTNTWFTSDVSLGPAVTSASDHLPVFTDFYFGQSYSGIEQQKNLPNNYELKQNYPNPFNPSTNIEYSLPSSGYVTLKVYDLQGREVAVLVNGEEQAGFHKISFNIKNSALSSGVYFYQLRSGNFMQTKKLIYLK